MLDCILSSLLFPVSRKKQNVWFCIIRMLEFSYKQPFLLGLLNTAYYSGSSFPSSPCACCSLTPSSWCGSGSAMLGTDWAPGGDLAGSSTAGLEGSQPPPSSSVLRSVALLRPSLQSDLDFPHKKQESPEISSAFCVLPFRVCPFGSGDACRELSIYQSQGLINV